MKTILDYFIRSFALAVVPAYVIDQHELTYSVLPSADSRGRGL